MDKIKKVLNVNKISNDSFYINVILTQSIKNIGTFTDVPILVKEGKPSATISERKNIKAITHSNLSLFKRYGISSEQYAEKYIKNEGSFIENGITTQWYDVFIDKKINKIVDPNTNISEIISIEYHYTLGGSLNGYLDSEYPEHGINYTDFYDFEGTYMYTEAKYKTNTQDYTFIENNGIISEEYKLNITDILDVESDIEKIDRGTTSVFENLQKLSEINNTKQISQYGKYFNEIY